MMRARRVGGWSDFPRPPVLGLVVARRSSRARLPLGGAFVHQDFVGGFLQPLFDGHPSNLRIFRLELIAFDDLLLGRHHRDAGDVRQIFDFVETVDGLAIGGVFMNVHDTSSP